MVDKKLYQGNMVKVISPKHGTYINMVGHVEDDNDTKYPFYPVKVYFPKFEICEHFTREQLEKL